MQQVKKTAFWLRDGNLFSGHFFLTDCFFWTSLTTLFTILICYLKKVIIWLDNSRLGLAWLERDRNYLKNCLGLTG